MSVPTTGLASSEASHMITRAISLAWTIRLMG